MLLLGTAILSTGFSGSASEIGMNLLFAFGMFLMLFVITLPLAFVGFFSWKTLKKPTPDTVKGMTGSWAVLLAIFLGMRIAATVTSDDSEAFQSYFEYSLLPITVPVIWLYYRLTKLILNSDGIRTGGIGDFVGKNTIFLFSLALWNLLTSIATSKIDMDSPTSSAFFGEAEWFLLAAFGIPILFYKLAVKFLERGQQTKPDIQVDFR
jgi:hypothetical protein